MGAWRGLSEDPGGGGVHHHEGEVTQLHVEGVHLQMETAGDPGQHPEVQLDGVRGPVRLVACGREGYCSSYV